MKTYKSEFLRTISERGFIHQCTNDTALDNILNKEKATVAYAGFDCTADSLHIGHLMPIMILRWYQRSGHKPIALMGGGTTKVGDPSGKDESRQILNELTIENNIKGIKGTFEKFLNLGNRTTDTLIVNNSDWLDALEYIPFLREFGKHFSINRMLSFDSVKLRLDREQPLSFLEFNYMILQAYDFLELSRRENCLLQIGGSDQWGNIVNGVELGRRVDGTTLYGITSPLIMTAAGNKIGKTAGGAVWLNSDRLSPYEYYQFWRNTADDDVKRFLCLFTELSLNEISKLQALQDAEINEAKKILAFEATKLCHGEASALEASDTSKATFEDGQQGTGLPTIYFDKTELENGIPAYEAFCKAGLANSNGAARRLIRGGGGRLNDTVIADESQEIGMDDVNDKGTIKLSVGKKRHVLARPTRSN